MYINRIEKYNDETLSQEETIYTMPLSLLHKQQVHSKICKNDKGATEYGESNTVLPQGLRIETKRAENSGARNLDIKAILVVDEGEIFDFVDNKAFEGVVEYRELIPC